MSVLAVSDCSGMVVFEPADEHAGSTAIQIARGPLEKAAHRVLSITLKYLSAKPVHVSEVMIAAHLMDRIAHVIASDAVLLESDPKATDSVLCKLLMGRNSPMAWRKYTKLEDDELLEICWKCNIRISNDYAEYRPRSRTCSESFSTYTTFTMDL